MNTSVVARAGSPQVDPKLGPQPAGVAPVATPPAATATAPAAPASQPVVVPRRLWIAILAAILGVFMAILDVQITNASLRDILGTLSATQEEGSWISTAYLATEIIAIPLTGLFARVFGIRNYMLGNSVLFLVFSTLCGLAWSLPSMITFRMLQGFTGGALIPTAMMLILTKLPPAKHATGLALLMLSTTLAPTLGPALGGWITALYSWPYIFYINWLPGVLLLAGIAYGLDRDKVNLSLFWQADWLSIALMAVGLGGLIVVLEEGNSKDWLESDMILTVGAIAIFSLAAWISLLLSRAQPFVNLRLFEQRNFLIASIVAAVTGMGLYGSTYLLPLFLAQIRDYNSLQIGWVILWMGMPQIVMMPITAKLSQRFDNRVICTVGLILFSISCFLNSQMTSETGADQLIISQVFRALGQPLILLTLSNFATKGLAMANIPSASSLFNMMRNLGGAVGTAVLATMLSRREKWHSFSLGESVTLFSSRVQEVLSGLSGKMILATNVDSVQASKMATKLVDVSIRKQAYVLAYNDCFLLMGVLLLGSTVLIWMADRVVAIKR